MEIIITIMLGVMAVFVFAGISDIFFSMWDSGPEDLESEPHTCRHHTFVDEVAFDRFLEKCEEGETVTVTRNGKPYLFVTPSSEYLEYLRSTSGQRLLEYYDHIRYDTSKHIGGDYGLVVGDEEKDI